MSGESDFGCFFKFALIFGIILGVFAFVFVSSSTLELQHQNITRDGMPYQTTSYIFHWDRFENYVTSIPTPDKLIFYPEKPALGK